MDLSFLFFFLVLFPFIFISIIFLNFRNMDPWKAKMGRATEERSSKRRKSEERRSDRRKSKETKCTREKRYDSCEIPSVFSHVFPIGSRVSKSRLAKALACGAILW